MGGQGAKRRSKAPMSAARRVRRTRRPAQRQAQSRPKRRRLCRPPERGFMQRSGMKTTRGATAPYALSSFSSYSELQRRIGVIFADVSAEMVNSASLSTAPLTQSTALGVVDKGLHFRWKDGVWLSTAFEVPWHRVDSLERSDAERVSPFDSVLVSPCRKRGHAAAFASHSARCSALPCAS